MDRLDLRLLKSLLVNNGVPPGVPALRKSFRSIGKELGVDQGTVRKRIRRFQEHRILRGWYLAVYPGIDGNDVVHAWFEVQGESSKGGQIEKLLSVPDVERVCDYLGPKLSIVLFTKKGTDQDATLRRLTRMLGPGVKLHKQGVIVTASSRLKDTDAAIISSLRRDPWKPFSAISEEIGLSERTVKRRVASLSEGSAIYMLPIIDLKALHGSIPMELVIDYASSRAKESVNEEIASQIKEGIVFSNISGPYGYFALVVHNLAQVEQITHWANQLPGVRRAHADLLQDVILNRSHYEIDKVPEGKIGRREAVSLPEPVRPRAGLSRTG